MFERIKNALSGKGGQSATAALFSDALQPLKGVSAELHQRSVAFITEGEDPTVLLDLAAQPAGLAYRLLAHPGDLEPWYWVQDDVAKILQQLDIIPRSSRSHDRAERIHGLRDKAYRSDAPSVIQWIRLARLFEAVNPTPNRSSKAVPVWFTALTNDLVASAHSVKSGPSKQSDLLTTRPLWTADRLASMLSEEGVADGDVPTVMLVGLFQDTDQFSATRALPADLPGVTAYLVAHASSVPGSAMSSLSASGRSLLAERSTKDPALANAVAHLLATLTVDTSKNARGAAIKALQTLDPSTQATTLTSVLAKAPASRSAEIVEYLAGSEGGNDVLQAAAAANARLVPLIDQATARRETIEAAPEAAPLEVPDFTPFPETSAEPAKAEVRRALELVIARSKDSEHQAARKNAARAAAVTEADLDDLVAIAEGSRGGEAKLLKHYNHWWLAEVAPSLTPLHLLRLGKGTRSRMSPAWLFRGRVDTETDPRVLEDALRRTGHQVDDIAGWVQQEADPAGAWPWAAEHPTVMAAWLNENYTAPKALLILREFPSLPPALVPQIAALAMGSSRVTRPLAQQVLSTYPAARELAEQALGDGRGEIRAAAGAWLASLADPAAVGALRAALAKEKREVPRASFLRALEASGDDISADLSPEVLLAEATKGLKAKAPASLSWFDFNLLPAVRWSDGTPVDPTIIRWWVILADKMKNPNGDGLIDRYLSLLDPEDASHLGTTVLRAWVAQDTRHPSDEESRTYAAVVGAERYRNAQDWVARIKANPKWANSLVYAEEQAAIPEEKQIASAYAEHQATYLGSATADKGLLALTTRMNGIDLAAAVQAYLRNNGGRRSQIESLIFALYANGQPAALQLLLSVARRHKMAGIQATALALVEEVADSRGWTPDELADRTIPAAGFTEDRVLHLDYGPREFIGRLTPAGTIELSTSDGRIIKSLPDARADEEADTVKETKKQLSTARKELKAVIALQSSRLYEAMCAGRTWTVDDWTEFLANHPLMSQLVPRLIWLENPGTQDQRAFRPTEDGALIDSSDEDVVLAPGATIGLAHRTTLGDEAAQEWRQHLSDYAVTPLFDQLSATLPAFAEGATGLDDLKGHLTDTFSFRGVAGKRGYQRAAAEDGGWFTEYLKPFASSGLTAVLGFTGSYLPEENITCATQTLTFRRRNKPVRLDDIPPVMLAECYSDYAALAALGPFDVDYEKKAQL